MYSHAASWYFRGSHRFGRMISGIGCGVFLDDDGQRGVFVSSEFELVAVFAGIHASDYPFTGVDPKASMFYHVGSLRLYPPFLRSFDGADLLLGEWARSLRIELFHADASLLLAILPPGGFIGLGLLIAGKNAINDWMGRKQRADKAHCSLPAAGARTTQL